MKSSRLAYTIAASLALLSALWSTGPLFAQPAAASQLLATLTAEKQVYEARDRILLRFTIYNNSNSTLHILKWGTPFEGFRKDMFLVTNRGVQIPYKGMLVKRGAPRPEDYLSIAPGDQASVVVDLLEGYDIRSAGDYSVEFIAPLLDVRPDAPPPGHQGAHSAVRLPAHPASFALRNNRSRLPPLVVPLTSFTNCSASEQTDVNTAFQAARSLAGAASTALQTSGTPTQAARYITWFGPHDAGRYSTVETHFSSISNALNTQNFDWDCHGGGCKAGDFAYVFAGQPYKIYFCSSFWSAGADGTDSRPGTIVHETSHFTVVAGTADHFYGHDNCWNLAQSQPANAVDNADSHEYFAENVPVYPMGPVTDPVRVRFSNTSTEIGTPELPYNTVGEGVSALADNGTLQIETGTSGETPLITKPMTIQAVSGPVTIGPVP